MTDRDDRRLHLPQDSYCFPTTIFLSLNIFLRNPKIFLSIFALATLPVSLLLFLLALSSSPIKSQILLLEAVAQVAPTRFEARHVWDESRAAALSLLARKALVFAPCFALSLAAFVSAATSVAAAAAGRRPSLAAAASAVRLSWKRPAATAICAYGVVLVYGHALRTLAVLAPAGVSRMAVAVVGAGFEVYLMGVLSLSLVASVLEDQVGWDAIRVGWNLMGGRRFCGWAISGCLLTVTSFIGWELEGMDGRDKVWGLTSTAAMEVVMEYGDKLGLACLFGLVVLWGYVVVTVFYVGCKKSNVKEENGTVI
ncbi:uncharacterized protein LOC131158768 [Malania oleifera]|uniref:uncharacterized protein LOC131158768 n=1 Tax=Malania oleifera TaxID=397392 RepID=UPI0025ADDABD|nr:uncharacterized protein LOC131158768 [Malania oleifera]